MDAATLRIILLVLGIAFLIALYFWEQRRANHVNAERSAHPPSQKRRPNSVKREPNLGLDDETEEADASDPGADSEPSFSTRSIPGFESERLTGIITGSDAGPIVQVFVVANDSLIAGPDILAAAERHLLRANDQEIFQRSSEDDTEPRPLFSMANLVRPGVFPLLPDPAEGMADFTTRGLALFAQVRGHAQDINAIDAMLATAELLAEELGAQVEDAHHRAFTGDRVDLLRACVLNYHPNTVTGDS